MLQELLSIQNIINSSIAFGVVVALIILFNVFKLFDVNTKKSGKCSRCFKEMTRAEELSSHRYFRKKAYEGRYYCKTCQESLLGKKAN